MEYKLVAIDLDDTLLADDLKISPQTIEAIQEAVQKGVTVTFATGRMYQSAVRFAKELNLNVPIITYQGAYVRNILDGDVIYERLLSHEISVDIITKLKEMGQSPQIYLNDELYAEKNNQYIEEYSKVSQVNYHIVDDLVQAMNHTNTNPMKIITIDDTKRVQAMLKDFKELYKDTLNINTSKPNFLEFTHKEATKGQAIKYMANKKGISLEEVIAIGDSYNDLDMIKLAGLGVVMENGHPDIKAIADYITKSNNDHGVWEVFQKFVLNE